MIVRSRAPVRIDFAGGTTDLSPFRDREGGAVLNATITRYAYCTLRSLPNGHVRITSEDLQRFVEAQHIRELEFDGNLDLLKAAVKALGIPGGFDITVRSDAPPGSGTGSSASVGVALIGMLDLLRQDNGGSRRLSRYEIADLASELESQLGIVGGKQDQYAAALGGVNFIRFFGEGRVSVERLSLPPEMLYEMEKHLVLCYSGESRLSGDTNRLMIEAYERDDPRVCSALREVKRAAEAMYGALLAGDLQSFGELLEAETAARVKLCEGVMTGQMARLRAAAMDAGAIGGKICGAGGGGCQLFFCAPDTETRVRRALTSAGGRILDFAFDHEGLQVWRAPQQRTDRKPSTTAPPAARLHQPPRQT